MNAETRSSRREVFVGRSDELEELRRGLSDVVAGEGRLFALTGEAGIGKTRLAHEMAHLAARSGLRVLWGRCWESGGAPAYWPWVQVLRAARRDLPAEAIDALWQKHAADLAEILADTNGELLQASGRIAEPEQARFRLFDATTSVLRGIARQLPLMLILDDLHAADQPSLLLLRFLARDLRGARLLLLATYRDQEAACEPAAAKVLAEVNREGIQLQLHGLSREDVADYLADGRDGADDQVVAAVYEASAGNPFFVSELARIVEHGAPKGRHGSIHVPEHVRVVIRERVASLPEASRNLLAVAAVLGREFEAPLLEKLSGLSTVAVRGALEGALRAGVVWRMANSLTRWSFAHVLLRDTLYDDLDEAERMQWHRRIGSALEAYYSTDLQPHLAEIAHHFVLGADAASADTALVYAQRAAQRAQSVLAYEEAVFHSERALQVLDLRRAAPQPGDAQCRVELLVALGDALWGAGDLTRMRSTFVLAAELARSLPASEGGILLGQAALGFGGRQQRSHLAYEQQVIDLLEEALARLPVADSALRARLLARLAYALYQHPGSGARRIELCQEAVGVARRLQDSVTLRWVLNDYRWALWEPERIEERLQISNELVALAERSGDRELALAEHAWRIVDLLELGDAAAVDAEIEVYTRMASGMRLPWYDWYVARFHGMRALLQGRFDDTERFAQEALAASQRVHHADAVLVYGTMLLALRTEQGRLEEMETALQAMVSQYPGMPVWRSVIAYMHAEQGRLDEASADLDRVAIDDFANLPFDYLRIPCLVYLADVCAALGDRRHATLLYDLLLPYSGRCVVVGYGVACLGAVDRYLAVLAATTRQYERAATHFEAALHLNQRFLARPALARTQCAYAEALHDWEQGDPQLAFELARAAAATAHQLGMDFLMRRADALLSKLEATAPAGAAPEVAPDPAAPASAAEFKRCGDVWTVAFDGTRIQLKDLLGFTYLAHLLRHPEREFHVFDLVSLVGAPSEALGATRSMALSGDAGEVLDARARAEYGQRLRDLKEDLSDAEECNDLGRCDRIREEMEVLAEELTRASGLGGRQRRVGSAAERARVSVTKRIGIAMRRIADHHDALAHHLSQTIKTGTFCSYAPDPRHRVRWEL